ncbi:MAG: Gfo/Idh/MocA family oxidoreductase [Planctomycetota bacterium]|nr:Gfo/Idh/MocA family oxidoreductase [Planctomycetota bacterium]
MSSKVRCAVIGLGMGRNHAKGYQECPDAELCAVADLDPNRLAEWASTVGQEHCYTDHFKMLKVEKPDLVSVALPNCLHAPTTLECLKAGAHVLCEKPMAMNVAQAQRMADTARKKRRKLGINLSYRFTPAARALKDLADDGFLGTPYHALTRWTRRDGFPKFGGWFGLKAMSGGGPLIDLGVHRIDLAMWLLGKVRPVSVSGAAHERIAQAKAKKQKAKFDCEDLACGFIRFDNGASLVLEISWGGHQGDAESMNTTVMGTAGTLVHRNENGTYQFVGEFHTERNGQKLSGTVQVSKSGNLSSYADMVEAVRKNREPLGGPEDGLRVQRVLDGLYRSAATGREVRITA